MAIIRARRRCRVQNAHYWRRWVWTPPDLPQTTISGVTISTIHASKGLEFKHVFLIGCSEGLLPYGSPETGDALEEERRLMYVGITRAEDSLHLSYARTKDGYGAQRRRPSRFL